jgi:hypothetical protein
MQKDSPQAAGRRSGDREAVPRGRTSSPESSPETCTGSWWTIDPNAAVALRCAAAPTLSCGRRPRRCSTSHLSRWSINGQMRHHDAPVNAGTQTTWSPNRTPRPESETPRARTTQVRRSTLRSRDPARQARTFSTVKQGSGDARPGPPAEPRVPGAHACRH